MTKPLNLLLAITACLMCMVASFAVVPAAHSSSTSLFMGSLSRNIFEDPGGWFKNKMEIFSDKREVTLYHILLRDADVQASVESGVGKTTVNPSGKLEELKASILATEPEEKSVNVKEAQFAAFQAAAKEFGSDSTAQNGGFVGKFGRGKLFSSVDDAVFNGEAKEVIGPVQSIYGHHIFWVSEITET